MVSITFHGIFFILMDVATCKFVDLTYDLSDEIPVYPSVHEFNFTDIMTSDNPFWFAINNFCTSEHIGTHLDAPYHFNKKGKKVHEIPIDQLIAPAVVMNISERIDQPEEYSLTQQDIEKWESINGRIPSKSIVFIYSGWGRFWNDHKKYIFNNMDNDADVRTPGFSADAVSWLIDNRSIVGLGVDTTTVEVGLPQDYPVHRVGTAANLYNLENVANLDLLPPVGATAFALPIKIKDGTGAPARVIAYIPDEF